MSAMDEIPLALRAILGDANVWGGELLDDPDLATGVTLYPGLTTLTRFGSAAVWRERPRVQILTRAPRENPAAGYARAIAARDGLLALFTASSVAGISIGGSTALYYLMTPVSVIYQLPKDDRRRQFYVMNFQVTKDPS